jgi:hypothetical protein
MKRLNVLILPNCQGMALASAWKAMRPDDQVARAFIPEFENNQKLADQFTRMSEQADVLVYIPTNNDYKAPFVRRSNISCIPTPDKVRVPGMFFKALHPELTYVKPSVGGLMDGPMSHYHSKAVPTAFLEGAPASEAISRLRDATTIDSMTAERLADASLAELQEREAECDVTVSDLIRHGFRDECYFHSIKHPSNILVMRFAEKLFAHLGIPYLRASPDTLAPILANTLVWPIPQPLADALRLTYSGWTAFRHGEALMSPRDFVLRCYATYCHQLEQLLTTDAALSVDNKTMEIGVLPQVLGIGQ